MSNIMLKYELIIKIGIGVTTGFIGVLFLFLDSHEISNDIRTGDLIILVAVLFWSCNAIYAKKIIHNFSSPQITWYPMLFGLPLFFLFGVLLFDDPLAKYL
ncbi:MAG: EamA family transporter [Desulfobacterales bacterium]|nr:EamA family transporter [Desulfobacterales bacterium]